MKIIFNFKSMIIEINNLKKYKLLFDIYILSLICTENTSEIVEEYNNVYDKNIYGISTLRFWKSLYFTKTYKTVFLEKNYFHNPFLSIEPLKETSQKKQKKIMKSIINLRKNKYLMHPLKIIDIYLKNVIDDIKEDINSIIEYEKKINILCSIRGFNKDIYMNIMKFM